MKILFIACYSPIINNSAAIETLQYLNKLCEIDGNEVHLLTVNFPEDSIYYDKELKELMDNRIKVHLIDGGKIFNRLVPRLKANNSEWADSASSMSSSKIKIMKILRKIKNSIVIPDMYKGFAKNGSKYVLELQKSVNFDVIFSMHEPPSSHLCALMIKKQNPNIPWITYWSDPWLKDSTRENSFIIKKKIESNMEKEVVKYADKFVFVTEANRQDYIDTYNIPREKTYIITRGYDKEFFARLYIEKIPSLIKKDKINIIYAGEIFSKLRNINPFIEAVKEIESENNDLYEKMNIMFFGNIDDAQAKTQLESLSIAKVSKRIPFNEAIKYMLHSQVLLLFGNKNSKQIPAKVYEYMGAEGTIFTIYGDENDPIKRIVENHKKCVNSLNNKDDIKENLMRLLQKDNYKSLPDENYEWAAITKRLNEILR